MHEKFTKVLINEKVYIPHKEEEMLFKPKTFTSEDDKAVYIRAEDHKIIMDKLELLKEQNVNLQEDINEHSEYINN